MMQENYKYRAFISYSHKDKAFAQWLHKRIENYKIPSSLREKYPYLPKDLKRTVFRDEEELPTASILSDNLLHALDNSEKLIVVCSPWAVGSLWVDSEILYFKQQHGEHAVLAVITGGEPNATYANDTQNEAFPKSLRYKVAEDKTLSNEQTEPIAGDARSYWDREMALMKMIAGILKVDFADLWRREKRERNKRRLIGLGIIAIIISLGIYSSTQFVGNKVNKELEQVTHKIASIEYSIRYDNLSMEQLIQLNDELKKLKELKEAKEDTQKLLGTLKTSLGKEAQEVYRDKGAQEAIKVLTSRDALSRKEQLKKELSQEDIALAKMYVETNKYEKAQQSYEDAIAMFFDYENALAYGNFLLDQFKHRKLIELYEELLKIKLSNYERAQLFHSMGVGYMILGEKKEAIASYEQALSIREKLAKENPTLYNRDLARTLTLLGSVNELRNSKKAAEFAKKAVTVYEEVKKTDFKGYQEDVIHPLTQLFHIYTSTEPEQALSYLNKAIGIQKSLENESPEQKAVLASLLQDLASTGTDNKEKIKLMHESLKIYEDLAARNPMRYTPNVGSLLFTLAMTYQEMKELDNAEIYFLKSLSERKRLFEINPEQFSKAYSLTLGSLAHLYEQTGKYEQAEKFLIEALNIDKELALKNPCTYSEQAIFTLKRLGNLYRESGQLKKAEAAFSESLSYYKYLDESDWKKYDLAELHGGLGLLYADQKQWDKALVDFSEKLRLYQEIAIGSPKKYNEDLAFSYSSLAAVYENINKYNKAEESYKKAIKLLKLQKLLNVKSKFSNVEHQAAIGLWLLSLSGIYQHTNEIEKSEAVLYEALPIYKSLAKKDQKKYEFKIAMILSELGRLSIYFQKTNEAEAYLLEALDIYKQSASNENIADTLVQLTGIYVSKQQTNMANITRNETIAIFEDLIKKFPENEEYHVKYALALLSSLALSSNQEKDFDKLVSIFKRYKHHPIAEDMLIKLAPYMKK